MNNNPGITNMKQQNGMPNLKKKKKKFNQQMKTTNPDMMEKQ